MKNGTELLDLVRHHISDPSYSEFIEINMAYKEFCRDAAYSWLRKSGSITFTANDDEYTLNLVGLRRLESLYTVVDGEKTYIEELSPLLFNELSRASTNTGQPEYFRLLEGTPFATLIVNPIPDIAYTGYYEYISEPEELGESDLPKLPDGYHEKIAILAAGFILRRSSDETKILLGRMYEADARGQKQNLVKDSFPNRRGGVSWTSKPWLT